MTLFIFMTYIHKSQLVQTSRRFLFSQQASQLHYIYVIVNRKTKKQSAFSNPLSFVCVEKVLQQTCT